MKQVNNVCTTSKTTGLVPLKKEKKLIYDKELQGSVGFFLQDSNSPWCSNS